MAAVSLQLLFHLLPWAVEVLLLVGSVIAPLHLLRLRRLALWDVAFPLVRLVLAAVVLLLVAGAVGLLPLRPLRRPLLGALALLAPLSQPLEVPGARARGTGRLILHEAGQVAGESTGHGRQAQRDGLRRGARLQLHGVELRGPPALVLGLLAGPPHVRRRQYLDDLLVLVGRAPRPGASAGGLRALLCSLGLRLIRRLGFVLRLRRCHLRLIRWLGPVLRLRHRRLLGGAGPVRHLLYRTGPVRHFRPVGHGHSAHEPQAQGRRGPPHGAARRGAAPRPRR
mmetsp:Transcript_64919/g.209064  ORF Transcript_64919/g.209064 Transcript_64919/m.209064 type:complete len:282 (-) Transcript_64919:53-898(-)